MMSRILLFLTIIALCFAVVQGAPTPTKVTRNERLTNAQRISRGLQPRAPERLYDPLVRRQPAPSNLP
ncbi:uncharacterized protein IL334_003605 [Kwoniella shivajii]|uniref:Uncharacterized protein n=1 Tax=Kwoniella shivajii TaxID=564305 RepID=A0ABZ1CYD9_9TREE|nr:hypothetical protein IL334_003605 [Kwoniella shivajii]